MINVTFEAAAATVEAGESDAPTRTIRGTAVPWNTVGTVSDGTRVKFSPGALDAAARPIVTLGHSERAIGRTAENAADAAGMSTTVKVSRTRDGDDALILAADGVLAMFSVGVNPTDWRYDDDGVMVVAAGDWHHTALLPFGAFPAAVVTDVAAAAPDLSNLKEGSTVTETATLDTDPPPPDVAAAAPEPPPAGAVVVPLSMPHRSAAEELTLNRVSRMLQAAAAHEDGAMARLQAALTSVTTTNVGAVVNPAYRSEINGRIDHGTPLLARLSQAPLGDSGMSIEYPEWVTKPTTGQQTTEKTAITSTAVALTMKTAPVVTIAGGNDLSMQTVERSSPSFTESYMLAIADDFARKAEAYVITGLSAIATAATPGASFLANIQAMLTVLNPNTTPPGPLWLACARNVTLPLVSVIGDNGPAWWDGSINFGQVMPGVVNDAGLDIFTDWNLPVDQMLLGARNGATWHQRGPTQLRVVDVSLLGVDVGIYGYVALTIEYPGAFVKMDTTP